KARSPQVRTHSFAAQPPDLRHFALITRASRFLARSPCSAAPSIRFLFIGSQLTLHASSPRSVTLAQLRFASFAVINLRRDLHPLECAHAGRTKKSPHKAGFLLLFNGGATRNRTGVHGFAGRCITTLPSRHDQLVVDPSLPGPREPDRVWFPNDGAGNEARTRDLNLGKVALYQLSYSRSGKTAIIGSKPIGRAHV